MNGGHDPIPAGFAVCYVIHFFDSYVSVPPMG
jgi:hypothetical protein